MEVQYPKDKKDGEKEREPASPWTSIGCFWFLLGMSLILSAWFLAPALADRISP